MEHVHFPSLGTRCAGDLYLPEHADGPVPGVVLGHSGVMVKEALADFAPSLAEAGFAALAIDYRTVGSSEGEPRGQLYPERQAEDLRAAVSYLRTRPEVDPDRIGLWGVSLGGMVAIQAAVFDQRVKAVVAHSPSIGDGWRSMLQLRGQVGFKGLRDALEGDWEARVEKGESARVPFLALEHEEARKSQELASVRYPTWRNEITLDSLEHMLMFAPENLVERLAPTPLLMIANGGYDPYHSLGEAQSVYRHAGEPKRMEVLPYDVLGLYTGEGLTEAMGLAVDWFDRYLRKARLATTTPAPTS